MDEGYEIRGVFLDISKAFDKVWHEGLVFKLKQNGISGDLLNIFEGFLRNRKKRVVFNGQTSNWKKIHTGAPQGSILGPLLFLTELIFYKDNARRFDRGEHYMQRNLYEHFRLPRHSIFLHDVSITRIDKTDPSCLTKREYYWIDTLKNKAHMGLNFDSDDSFWEDCLVFLPFCNWIGTALFKDIRFWVSDVFVSLKFVTELILVSYYIAVVIFVSLLMSFI